MSGVPSTKIRATYLFITDRIDAPEADARVPDERVETSRRAREMRRLIIGRPFKRRVFSHGAKA